VELENMLSSMERPMSVLAREWSTLAERSIPNERSPKSTLLPRSIETPVSPPYRAPVGGLGSGLSAAGLLCMRVRGDGGPGTIGDEDWDGGPIGVGDLVRLCIAGGLGGGM
jgi:hypothetical protein